MLHNIRVAIDLMFAALAVYIAVSVYLQYRKETGKTGFARWLATARDSATMLAGKFALVVTGIVSNLDVVFDSLGLPQVSDFINKTVSPTTAAATLTAIAVGGLMLGRMRTLGK